MPCRLSPLVLALSLATPLSAALSAQQVDGGRTTHEQIPACMHTLRDQFTGDCIGVSSSPTMGMLYPLGPELGFNSLGHLSTNRHFTAAGVVTGLARPEWLVELEVTAVIPDRDAREAR